MTNSPLQGQVLDTLHLPIVREILERLGILAVIHRHCPPHPLAEATDAECAAVLILNILSGRLALYRMEHWLGGIDLPLLLGPDRPAALFHDTRLALFLDHLDEAGTDTVLSEIVDHYLRLPDQPTQYSLHQDGSSLLLYGAYAGEGTPRPAHGFSKDHRPDLKQLVFGLTVRSTDATPLAASWHDGNTADQTVNRTHIERLADRLPEEHDVTLVADCKAADGVTVGQILLAGFHVITLLPETFAQRHLLIDAAWAQRPRLADWPTLAQKPAARKGDPPLFYRGWSVPGRFPVQLRAATDEAKAVISAEEMRFLIVASDTLAAKFDAGLPRLLEKERETLQTAAKRANGKGFACQADALAAAQKVAQKAKLHRVSIESVGTEKPLKRAGPGRPPKGQAAPTETVWTFTLTLTEDAAAIEQARQRGSCFVLLTDHLDEEDWPDSWILGEYRYQSLAEGHTGFRWFKSEAQVAPMFLKTPERIRAMGLLFVLALMVRNYLQFRLRQQLSAQGLTILHPFTRKAIADPTAEMAFVHFDHVRAIYVTDGSSVTQRIAPTLSPDALLILQMLDVPEDRFRIPFPPIGPPKSPPPPS